MKTSTIIIFSLIVGYWTGNLMTSNRANDTVQKQLVEEKNNYTLASRALLQCEEKYALLKNGDITKANEIEKKQDNGTGW